MNLFFSCSGRRSYAAAKAFEDFLGMLFRSAGLDCQIYLASNTEMGTEWRPKMETALNQAEFAILFLTRENCDRPSPWMMYEAGVLSKNTKPGHMFIFLLNNEAGEIPGPVSQIQAVHFSRNDILDFVIRLYILDGDDMIPLGEKADDNENNLEDLIALFDLTYDNLEKELNAAAAVNLRRAEEDRIDRALANTGRLLKLAAKNQVLLHTILHDPNKSRGTP